MFSLVAHRIFTLTINRIFTQIWKFMRKVDGGMI